MSEFSGTGAGATDDMTRLQEFLRVYVDKRDGGHNEIAELAERPRNKRSIEIDYSDLQRFDHELADDLIEDPDEVLEKLEAAVRRYDYPADMPQNFDPDVRVTGLQTLGDEHTFPVGSINTDRIDEDPFAVVRGQVSRASQVKPLVKEASFECQRCGTTTTVPQHSFSEWSEPHECMGCERQGPFTIVESHDVDFQLVRLQRPPEDSRGGTKPATLDIRVTGDLVREVTPGDRVRIGSILDKEYDDEAPTADIVASANSIEKQQTDFEDIDWEDHLDRIQEIANSGNAVQKVVDSIKPSHRGDAMVKEAIALQMFGGVEKELPDGSEIRAEPHILLVGDPGTDKTGLLQYAADLSPRSVQTSGKSTTAAGLTAAAVNTDFGDGGWTLEAGALVEATGGLCAIDEFDKVDEEDRKGANQAMSQGKITPAKAGIKNVELPAKTTVLAAANPKYGRFDEYEPIGEQIDLDPTVFSRFDLIFTMTDSPDPTTDRNMADHILRGHQIGAEAANGAETDDGDTLEPAIEPEVLRAYIAYAKENVKPVITDDALERIKEFYAVIREQGVGDDAPVPITPRKLDALVRLADASARMRLSNKTTLQDAERVIDIMQQSLKDVGVDPETGEMDADVVETGTSKAQRDRIKTVKTIIEELELEYEEGAPVDEVLELLKKDGMPEAKAEDEIENLRKKGEVYEPVQGHLRAS
jgi:replicative DNA helicase Mcm